MSSSNQIRAKTPLKAILEEINQKQADENGVQLFKIDGDRIDGVGILPIAGDKAILLAVADNKTELLSDLDLSKPMGGDLTILCMLTMGYNSNLVYKKYITSSVVAGLLKLAEKDNQNAQVLLWECYQQGLGVSKDEVEAVKWVRKAAEQGNVHGQVILSLCYKFGKGITQDDTEATKWFRKAADQGDAFAQYELGECYLNGLGIAKDEVEALKWFLKAADQGNDFAQYGLGECERLGYCKR